MEHRNVDFSSKNIKRKTNLLTNVKKTKIPFKDRVKSFIEKNRRPLIIAAAGLIFVVLAFIITLVIINANQPGSRPPTTEDEVEEVIDQINALRPDLADPEIAEEEKNLVVDGIDEKTENTETPEDRLALKYAKTATLFKYGDYNGAIANHLEIIPELEADADYERIVEAYEFISDCYVALGDSASAISTLEKALTYFDTAIAAKRPIMVLEREYYESMIEDLR